MRRALEMIIATLGLLILSPVFVVIAIAIKLDDGQPVFYKQPRVGKAFRAFHIYKFRSMIPGSDRGGLLTAPEDARLTRVGKTLRRLKLDELPQLFNLLMGDMQLVGPRPEVARYVERFYTEYQQLLQDRPGITDPATLMYRREDKMFIVKSLEEQYISQIVPNKLRISLAYQKRRDARSDLKIVVKTVFCLGAFSPPNKPNKYEDSSEVMEGR